MVYKIAVRYIRQSRFMCTMVTLLLTAAVFVGIVMTSSVCVKLRKYIAIAPYLKQNGVLLVSQAYCNQNGVLLRDAEELREWIPDIKDVLCAEEIWDLSVVNNEKTVQTWCYSEEVIDLLNPEMSEGRWFTEADTGAEMLQAVVSCSDGKYKVGDTVTLGGTELSDGQITVKIIGVLDSSARLYNLEAYDISYEDYRDCYEVYRDLYGEDRPLFILSDAQILAGQDDGRFSELNYRLNSEVGLQKQMHGVMIITFADGVSQETIDHCVSKIKMNSGLSYTYTYNLSKIRQNSLDNIYQSLKIYIPIFICIMFFLLIATISANVIMAKRQMRNYVIYYTCGLTWKKCASISFGVSMLLSAASVILTAGVTVWLMLTGKETHLFGLWQILTVAVILIFYNVMAWIVPYSVVRKESAVHIITENNV